MIEEVWKDIPGYEGLYQVSDLGRVKSLARKVRSRWGGLRSNPEKILEDNKGDADGYLRVTLSKEGKAKVFFVHYVVLLAFVGPYPEGVGRQEVRHFPDRNRKNNKLLNLSYGTSKQNGEDSILHGTSTRGARSLLSIETVALIKQDLNDGLACRAASEKYGVNYCVIRDIKREKSWYYVQPATKAKLGDSV